MAISRVGIVTGSASGIGAATARALATQGWGVVINYSRSGDAAERVAAECESLGGAALVCQADISEDAACRRLVATTLDRWGRLDALVNNAGISKFCPHHKLDGLDRQDFLDIYSVNVVGAFQMIRAAVPALKTARRGSIVNMASVAGIRGVGSSVAYAASKGALITMTKSLARALGPDIRVNAVCPGFVQGQWLEQGMGRKRYQARKRMLEEASPLRLTTVPEDIAEGVLTFIIGPQTVTGETLILDGGAHLD